jgi:PKD domain/Regulator of chromosome condensation (RCC1) repeat
MRRLIIFLVPAVFLLGSCRPDAPTSPSGDLVSASTLGVTAASFSTISAGLENTCALDATGHAVCMGYGASGAVGYGGLSTFIIVPFPVTGGLAFSQISNGGLHVCALTPPGVPYCWGDNGYGQLGVATPVCGLLGPCSPAPIAVSGGLILKAIDGGNQFTCGLDLAGRAYCWGDNTFGQLGDGTTTAHLTPKPVLGGLNFVAIRAGGFHACAITGAGQLYCWGHNGSSQLGTAAPGTCTYFQPYPCATIPVPVGGARRFLTMDAGALYTCAIDTANRALCWGNNSFGQTGVNPKGTDVTTPTLVGTTKTFTAIATGYKETCAIEPGGQGDCWGAVSGITVTPIAGFSWTTLSPNDDHRCGITTGGGAFCWGHEDYGEMGEGGTHQDTRTAPTALAPVHGIDQPPVARVFIAGCTGLACTFNGTLSTDDYGIVRWDWTFGDGTSGTGSIVNHTYTAGGSYLVTLTVTDTAGQPSSASINATVFGAGNLPPTARFSYSCSLATLKCSFNARASSDDQGIASYGWHSSLPAKPDKTGVTMVRNFVRGQTWYETLTVTDAMGATATVTRKVITP